MHFAQGVTYHLLGQAGAFAALAGDAEGGANIAVTAAAFIDGFANLTVSNTFAETDVHDESSWQSRSKLRRILMLMRMRVKDELYATRFKRLARGFALSNKESGSVSFLCLASISGWFTGCRAGRQPGEGIAALLASRRKAFAALSVYNSLYFFKLLKYK